jgi:hypothetical protein
MGDPPEKTEYVAKQILKELGDEKSQRFYHLARIIHQPKNRSEKVFVEPSEVSKQPYPRLVTLPKPGYQIVLTLGQAV